MSVPQQNLSSLLKTVQIHRDTRYNAVATLVWIIYDFLLCLDREMNLIWRTRWSIPKAIYLSLRYGGVFALTYLCLVQVTPGPSLSELVCRATPTVSFLLVFLLSSGVEIMFIIRIRALYPLNPFLISTVVFLFCVSSSVVLVVDLLSTTSSISIPAPASFLKMSGCIVTSVDRRKLSLIKYGSLVYLFMAMFYFALTLWRFSKHIRSLKLMEVKFATIYSIFITDGTVYFAGVVVANTLNTIFVSGNGSLLVYADIMQCWLMAFYSYAGCHLILRLREARTSALHIIPGMNDLSEYNSQYQPTLLPEPYGMPTFAPAMNSTQDRASVQNFDADRAKFGHTTGTSCTHG